MKNYSGKTIMLWGPPGSGKSTFSNKFRENIMNYRQFSIRLFCQRLICEDHSLGEMIQRQIVEGYSFFTLDLVIKVFNEFLSRISKDDFLLIEGFPIDNAQNIMMNDLLEKYERQIDLVLFLTADKNLLLSRILNRLVCTTCEKKNTAGVSFKNNLKVCPHCGTELTQRNDDITEIFYERMDLHEQQREFILSHYETTKIKHLTTDVLTKEEVFAEGLKIMDACI